MAKAKILVVDDEKDICEFSKNMLERTGRFEVITTSDPETTFGIAGSFNPDLIILDVLMPGLSGSEVADCLARNPATSKIPIVFLTALVQKSEVEMGAGVVGAHFFIAKPIQAQELISRIESILLPHA